MDVNQFEESLDILKEESDLGDHLKSTGLLLSSLFLLLFPATALRWDGTLNSPKLPNLEEVRQVEPSNEGLAFLFRTLRIGSVIASAVMAGYAAKLDTRIMENIPLKRKKREARSILEDELLNARLNRMLPQDEGNEQPQQPALPPALAKFFGKASVKEDEGDEDLEALAAKFKTSQPVPCGEAETTAVDKFEKYRKMGEAIINSMVVSDKSVMIASGTGTGKTTTEREYLKRLKEKYPNITLMAFLNKGDTLPSVPRSETTMFDPDLLTAIYEEESGVTLRDALAPLFDIFDIFSQRRQLSEEQRKHLKENQPIRLILGDWFYTYQELQARLTKKDFQQVLSMIRGIITVGRDSGVGLIVDTQSANLSALGLADDQSIRQSLDIYSQGFIYYEDGEVKGELETIRLVFGLNGVCSAENRKAIAEHYKILATAIERGELKTPIIFTSVGARPRIGIVPNLETEQTVSYSPVVDTRNVEDVGEANIIEYQDIPTSLQVPKPILEMNLDQMIAYFTDDSMSDEDKQFGVQLAAVLNAVNTANKTPVSYKQMYDSRVWTKLNLERPRVEKLKILCSELANSEWLVGNDSEGWSIAPVN